MARRRSKSGGDGSELVDKSGRRKGSKGPTGPPSGGHAAWNTDGYPVQAGGAEYEADLFGGHSYYREADGQTYYGQEAIDMYEQDHPGEGGPHDGITGEAGTYYSWDPSDGGDDQDEYEDDRWGAPQAGRY